MFDIYFPYGSEKTLWMWIITHFLHSCSTLLLEKIRE